jgi:branched-chain amino acid transport system permease protein
VTIGLGLTVFLVALAGGQQGTSAPSEIKSGGLLAAVFAAIISLSVFRFRGIYFAIGTLAVSEVLRLWMVAWPVTGGSQGLPVPLSAIPEPGFFYYFSLLIAIASTLVLIYTIDSKLGKGWRAIRDNEDVAQSLGVNIYRAKLVALVISSFITGLVGGVWATKLSVIEPYSIFNVSWTISAVNMVIIGGMGTLVGPCIGAIFVVLLGHLLADYYAIQVLLTGVILILVIRFAPEGIWGLVVKVPAVRRALAGLALVRDAGI